MIAPRLAPPSGADRYPEPVSEPLGKETILPVDCAGRAVVRSRAPTERNGSLRNIGSSKSVGGRHRSGPARLLILFRVGTALPDPASGRAGTAATPVRPPRGAFPLRSGTRTTLQAQADRRRNPVRRSAPHHDLGPPI